MILPADSPPAGPLSHSLTPEDAEARGGTTRWALSAVAVAGLALVAAAFLLLAYAPLEMAGLAGQLVYGDWIVEHRALPASDPTLPLAEGMPLLDASWGSEAILAAVARAGDAVRPGAGYAWLATLFAFLRLATLGVLWTAFSRALSGRAFGPLGLLGAVAVLALSLSPTGPYAVFLPQIFGALCLALFLVRIERLEAGEGVPSEADSFERKASANGWAEAVALAGWAALFALWANLHVSFAVGLAALSLATLGRLIEALGRARRVGARPFSAVAAVAAVAADRPLRRFLRVTLFAAAGTLFSPYGIELWRYVLRLPRSANLADLPAFRALSVESPGGWALALLGCVAFLSLSFSARREGATLRPQHALWLAGFGAAALAYAGLLAGVAPLLVYALLPSLAARRSNDASFVEPFRPLRSSRLLAGWRERLEPLRRPSWRGVLLAAALAWAAFALSPVGAALLRREVRPREAVLSSSAPFALADHLRAQPPSGLTFLPAAWADWLVREGPRGAQTLRPFAGTRVETLPPLAWQDYLRVAGGAADWQRVLGRYGVRTAIFDRATQHGQIQSLRYDDDWRIAYEDDRALVFERISKPAGRTSERPLATPAGQTALAAGGGR